jgi:hypothetical protein
MTDEEQAIQLVEAARKKLARASGLAPDMAVEFAEAIRGLGDLADDLDDDDGEDGED